MSIDDIFQKIAASRPTYAPPEARRLPPGEHRVALERIEAREGRRGPTVVATMRVLGADETPVDRYDWVWFVGTSTFTAEYEEARCKDFIVAALRATGAPTDPDAIARAADDPEHFLGVVLDVKVVEQDSRHRPNRKVVSAVWSSRYQPLVERWRTSVLIRPQLAREVGLRAERRALEFAGISGSEAAQNEASECMNLFRWCVEREVPEEPARSETR